MPKTHNWPITAGLTALAAATCLASAPTTAAALSDDVVRIAFITDLSGPYESVDGKAGEQAIRMALADWDGRVAGKRIELIAIDHHNDARLAASAARKAIDEQGADVIIGGVNTDTSLAMIPVARERHKPFLVVGAGSSRHTNELCSPYTVQWAYDTTALSKVTANGLLAAGGRSWYFLTADYPFGLELERDTSVTVTAGGGTVVGSERHPHEETHFATYVQRALATSADVIAFASGHSAMEGAMTSARAGSQADNRKFAGLLVFIDGIRAMGTKVAGGLYHADSWYWTRDARTRAWSRRFHARTGRMPSSLQAADYSAAYQYLAAVAARSSDDGDAVMAQLRSVPVFDDMYLKNGHIRPDGLMTHDMYLLQVRQPGERAKPWDYSRFIGTYSGDKAWARLAETRCPALRDQQRQRRPA